MKFLSPFFAIALMAVALGGNIALAAPPPNQAAAPLTTPTPLEQLKGVLEGDKSGLSSFEGRLHQLSSVDPGADLLTSIIFSGIDLLKYVLGTIAIIFAIISGVKMIMAGTKIDEVSTKEKTALKYIGLGLILVIVADELVTKVFFGDYGECLASATNSKDCAIAGGSVAKGMYSLIWAMLASVSVLVLVIAGFRMVTSAGNEEVIGKEKKRIMYAVLGLLLAGVAEFAVKKIIFRDGGEKGIDVEAAQKLVISFTNFIASFIGVGAFVMLIYGGYLYLASFGNEEQTGKAKKIIIGAFIGITIAFAAYAIVNTIIAFSGRLPFSAPAATP